MAHPKLKLELPEAADIDRLHARERDPWRKNRLLAVKLAVRGEHTAAQVAEFCGIARGHLFRWIKTVRERGLEALIERGRIGTRPGTRRGLDPAVDAELNAKLAAGEFVTAMQAKRWLKEEHGVDVAYRRVWQWLKKAGGVRGSGRGRFTPKKTPRPKRNSKRSWLKSLKHSIFRRAAGSSSG